jgi:hypothetical protein
VGALGEPVLTRGVAAARLGRWLRAALGPVAVALVYWLAASAVQESFLDHWALGDKWRNSRLNRVIQLKVPRPFAYRVLTPLVIDGISDRAPLPLREWLASRAPELRERYGLRQGNDVEYAVAYYLMFASFFGTLWVWRASLRLLGRGGPLLWSFAPPLALLLLPMTFMHGGFVYDPPELLLTSTALHFFLSRRWLLFYPTFVACVLNKESAILLPIWFVAAFLADRDRRSLLRHGALSVAVGAPPFLLVRWWMRGADAYERVERWRVNLGFLLDPANYVSGFEAFAAHLPAPRGFHLVNLLLLAAVLVTTWRLRWLRLVWLVFVCTVLVYLPFYVFYGNRDEIRVLAPSFAALVLLGVHAVREVLVPREASEETSESRST